VSYGIPSRDRRKHNGAAAMRSIPGGAWSAASRALAAAIQRAADGGLTTLTGTASSACPSRHNGRPTAGSRP
jgi:hypothetical protein